MIINGEKYNFETMSLQVLIETLEINIESVVAEVNGEIVPRTDFQSYQVDKGAVVELVAFVGGG